mgnify:CR=1 FL=1
MKNILEKPYLFFLGFIPFFVAIIMLFDTKTINLSYYGGKFEINLISFSLISIGYFALISLNYYFLKWMNKKVIKWISFLHIFFQIIATFFLFYVVRNADLFFKEGTSNIIITIAFFIFLISFFFHFINFVVSIFLKKE